MLLDPAHTREERIEFYLDAISRAQALGPEVLREVRRELCRQDVFYLLVHVLRRHDANHDFVFARCKEVQANPDGFLDLWAREHYKSTIITLALTIQEVLRDPEVTICIFSYTRPLAKKPLKQIMNEFEGNEDLKELFSDVLWADPRKEAPRWSLDDGIVVRRTSNPKESTVEAWGMTEGLPTGSHFQLRVYDDVIDQRSVTNPDMIKGVIEQWELSLPLGTRGGRARYVGTRYHSNDPYNEMMKRGSVVPRIYPATHDGTMTGQPVFMSQKELADRRRDWGPFTFCFPGQAPILMADWSERRIDMIVPGDEVVGIDFPDEKFSRMRLVAARVKNVFVKKAPINRYDFESGRHVICTPNHKWFTGRRGKEGGGDHHNTYAPLGKGIGQIEYLCSLYDPRIVNAPADPLLAGWLGGIFDGEGSISAGTVFLTQSHEHNPEVCQRIGLALSELGLPFGKYIRAASTLHGRNNKASSLYYLLGDNDNSRRQMLMKFLQMCRPVKWQRVVQSLFDSGTTGFGYRGDKDKLMKVTPLGEETVYNIETETGNYFAYGYATKNCAQMLQNPSADATMGFQLEWMKTYREIGEGKLNKYILVDPASAKKKESDYTVMVVVGLGPDRNYYLLDMVRDRLNLSERQKTLFALHEEHSPLGVGYEKYGMQCDVEYFQIEMARENYRFDITELGGSMAKTDRIKRLIPLFEQGRIWLPPSLIKTDYEHKRVDLVDAFVNEEYRSFPVPLHDDMLDALSRICDDAMSLTWPKGKPRKLEGPDYGRGRGGRMLNAARRGNTWMVG